MRKGVVRLVMAASLAAAVGGAALALSAAPAMADSVTCTACKASLPDALYWPPVSSYWDFDYFLPSIWGAI